jgi:hypothetical protein
MDKWFLDPILRESLATLTSWTWMLPWMPVMSDWNSIFPTSWLCTVIATNLKSSGGTFVNSKHIGKNHKVFINDEN